MPKSRLSEVARLAGVSPATVSRSFTNPGLVSDETRKRVLRIAQDLDFTVVRAAASLRSGKTFRAALLVGERHLDWFGSQVLEGLEGVLHDSGYDIAIYLIGTAEDRKRFFMDLPIKRNADMVFVSSIAIKEDEAERLQSADIPIVGINVPPNDSFNAWVSIDDRMGIRLAVQLLTSLGHRHIGFVKTTWNYTLRNSSQARQNYFTRICSENTEDISTDIFSVGPAEDRWSPFFTQLLAAKERPTALVCQDDSIAIPLLYQLQEYGIKVPDDMSIVGFDDSNYAGDVGLTTIRQVPQASGISAAQKALKIINGEKFDDPYETVTPELVLRKSTATCKGEAGHQSPAGHSNRVGQKGLDRNCRSAGERQGVGRTS